MNSEYQIAYKEVLEILKYVSLEDYNKIPKEKIKLFQINAKKDYEFNYNPRKTLSEQNVSKIAKGIIAILFRDYWSTPAQKEKIIRKQKIEREKIELQKKEKYNSDIFKNGNKRINNENVQLIKIEKEKWFVKLKRFIHNILKK